MKGSSQAQLGAVIMTTSSAARDSNFVKMTAFPLQWFDVSKGSQWDYVYGSNQNAACNYLGS